MAVPIVPRICRGRLYFQVADASFPAFDHAVAALPAAGTHRLYITKLSLESLAALALSPVHGGGA